MDNGIVKYKSFGQEIELSADIIRRQLVHGSGDVTDREVSDFLMLCRYQGLNPFLREAYLIKYGSDKASMIVGRDAFAKRAEADPAFRGIESGVWVVGKSGEPVQRPGALVLSGEKLVGGWARVHKEGRVVPYDVSVSYDEYVGKTKQGEVNRQWRKMPATMINKVAEVQCLRKAFPDQLGALYDAAEIGVDYPEEQEPRNVTPSAPQEKVEETTEKIDPLDMNLSQVKTAIKSEGTTEQIEEAEALYYESPRTDEARLQRLTSLLLRIRS